MCPNIVNKNENTFIKRKVKDILPLTFRLMIFCGLWEPFGLSSFLKILYKIYKIFVMFIIISMTLSLVCVTFFSENSIKIALFENLFLLLTLLNGCIKILIILMRKNKICSLMNALKQYQPENLEEEMIQIEFDAEAKKITNVYLSIILVSLITLYPSVFLVDKDERIKILNVWRPYNLSTNLNFWITFIHEYLGHLFMACCHICSDTLIPGFIIHICCQLKFLQYRLKNLPSKVEDAYESKRNKCRIDKFNIEKNFIIQIIKHHDALFTISKQLKETFVEILFFQFLLSVVVICFSIIKLSKGKVFDSTSLIIYPYLSAMLFQLFLYCWYGNSLMLKSLELQEEVPSTAFFLEKETRKSIVILIIRSSRPIVISVGSLISVNLESFVKILRAAFSAFNVLAKTV